MPYAELTDATFKNPKERVAVESVMIAGLTMTDANGLRFPFLIPPAVALAIVRALADKDPQ